MKTQRCCHAPAVEAGASGGTAPRRLVRGAAEWMIPGAILVVMPKCPVCVAAYVALFTGLGISLSSAAHLRLAVLTVCVVVLAFLVAKRVRATGLAWVAAAGRK